MKKKIGIVGLGYVGLPLAIEFSQKHTVTGYDVDISRINELKHKLDNTLQISTDKLEKTRNIHYTCNLEDLKHCQIFIITVPTPIDQYKNPDLSLLKNASGSIGSLLKRGDIVIYESTVYPGVTEDICVPILKSKSGLIYNKDFFCGYSPERINPGDTKHQLTSIKKIVSGSTRETTLEINNLYKTIITAGTYVASSIKIAEAAKIIENIQRDINIALMNELAIIFNKLQIDTSSVIEAASTKWNFLPFKPGLVGGHCIGVDPYYLAQKAEEIGYNPEIILAGRRINDSITDFISEQIIKLMIKKRIQIYTANILIMGLTFKENCPDIRNTKVDNFINIFNEFNCNIDVYDPWVEKSNVDIKFNFNLVDKPRKNHYDLILLAVAHSQFKELSAKEIRKFGKTNHVFFDVKSVFNIYETDGRL